LVRRQLFFIELGVDAEKQRAARRHQTDEQERDDRLDLALLEVAVTRVKATRKASPRKPAARGRARVVVRRPLRHVYEGRANRRANLWGMNFKHGASGQGANATRDPPGPSTQ